MKNTTDEELINFFASLGSFKDERFFIYQLHITWKIFIWFIYSGALIIGTAAKIVLFCHIFKSKLKEQPINILIFAEQVVHHFCATFILIAPCLSLPLDISPGSNFTEHFLLQLTQESVSFLSFRYYIFCIKA
jgi:hypothetical protein